MRAARVVAVGLGPAGADLLLPRARQAIERIPVRFARTARHPAVDDLRAEGIEFDSFDDLYAAAERLEEVYAGIVERLVEAAGIHGEVLYAVPGSPAVAERSVALLLGSQVEVEMVPGLSFADLAWSRLGVDPLAGARVVDGREIEDTPVTGPLLIAQCDSLLVLSQVKLALLERFRPETPVVVLQRLGLPDEAVVTVPLVELDRSVEPDHLTSVFVEAGPEDAAAEAAAEFARFVAVVERLRAPGGCPWDAEQTHRTLVRYAIEEVYELVEALEALPAEAPGGEVDAHAYRRVEEELGDVLAQVVIHATLAREAEAFTVGDVVRRVREKLVRRHPHVFGEAVVEGAEEVTRNWERIKRDEKGTGSLMAGLPGHLPALLYAHKLFRKAASGGLPLMTEAEAARAAVEAVGRLEAAGTDEAEHWAGEALAALTLLARHKGFDAEAALRGWAGRFRRRFQAMERLAAERGVAPEALAPEEAGALWVEAGAQVAEPAGAGEEGR